MRLPAPVLILAGIASVALSALLWLVPAILDIMEANE